MIGQPAGSLGIAGKDDYPRDGSIQPVRDAEVDVAGLFVLVLVASVHAQKRHKSGKHNWIFIGRREMINAFGFTA